MMGNYLKKKRSINNWTIPLRILIVSTYFPPLNSIASLRPYSWAKTWHAEGHEVTVLTTYKSADCEQSLNLPNHGFRVLAIPSPRWIQYLKVRHHAQIISKETTFVEKRLRAKCKRGISRLYEFLRYKKGVFNTCRMPDFTDFWIRPALKAIKHEPSWDLVISTAGPYATHIVAQRIKVRGQASSWIADYRDAWSDSRIYPGIFPFNKLEKWLETWIIKKADCITTISEAFANEYRLKFPKVNVATIENGFDPVDLINLPEQSIFPNDHKFRIVYTGSIYKVKQDPSPLFKAISMISKDPLNSALLHSLEIVFAGSNQHHLQELIKSHRVEPWVKLKGLVSREDALRMQRDANALLFLAWNDSNIDGILTGKLFEYLFSKTFILSINNQGIESSQKIILEAKAGKTYSDPAEIAEWLKNELASPVKMKSQIDQQILNRYNREFLAKKLLNCFSTSRGPLP